MPEARTEKNPVGYECVVTLDKFDYELNRVHPKDGDLLLITTTEYPTNDFVKLVGEHVPQMVQQHCQARVGVLVVAPGHKIETMDHRTAVKLLRDLIGKERGVACRCREMTDLLEEFADNITSRDFLHLRGPSDDDMEWLRGFIKRVAGPSGILDVQ